jgi:hypothetical protein
VGVRTEELTFYHGTDERAARAILTSGARHSIFEEIGARALGREIRSALLETYSLSPKEDWRLHFLVKGPGSDSSGLWVSALRQLDDPQDKSLIEYGHFFATLNIGNAYRYAIDNPYRSEFILALAESLKILESAGHPLPKSVASRFPEVDRLIRAPSSPLVLELRGISHDRLRTEDGGRDVDARIELFLSVQLYSGVNDPAAFRIQTVTARDVVAVHLLDGLSAKEVEDSFWQPSPSNVAAMRLPVHEWLAHSSDLGPGSAQCRRG